MTWINRLLPLFSICTCLYGRELSVKDSYDALFHSIGPVHATLHINNLIRQGAIGLTDPEKARLTEIGLSVHGSEITVLKSTDLDQTLDTDHFRFYYTLDGSSNHAVENEDYVTNMGAVFEEVWSFHIDSMGFDKPPMGPDDLYEVNIENLPSNYFGYAVAQGSGSSCNGYISMRNSYTSNPFKALSETDNIKVTAVHEFFHAIQFGYNCYSIRNLSGDLWFMEATAVWSEDELYNGINDLYRYMPTWFSNPDQSINDQSTHMYGTFILFQYIDEHLGGPETIKACWENSKNLAHPTQDVSFDAVDAALEPYNSSLEDAYIRMRIANQILSSSENAGVYSYEEADDYLTVVSPPPKEDYFFFEKGDIESIDNYSLQLYESHYYSLSTETPVAISLTEVNGEFSFTSIVKIIGTDQWIVKSGLEQNIDPEIGIEWITLIVSALGENENDWDYSLSLSDGYSEDFTFYPPYPNPSKGQSVNFEFQVITEQTIDFQIIDILGQVIWEFSSHYSKPEVITVTWDGKNQSGQGVANGVYFGFMKGKSEQKVFKITYLKKSN